MSLTAATAAEPGAQRVSLTAVTAAEPGAQRVSLTAEHC